MSQPQPLRCIGDRRLRSVWGSGEVQHKLMLLRVQARVRGAQFAEVEKLAQRIAKFSESLQPSPVL